MSCPSGRRTVPVPVRMQVWRVYFGQQGFAKCPVCDINEISMGNFECGHKISHAHGGRADVGNFIPLCSACNRSMGARDIDDYIERHKLKPKIAIYVDRDVEMQDVSARSLSASTLEFSFTQVPARSPAPSLASPTSRVISPTPSMARASLHVLDGCDLAFRACAYPRLAELDAVIADYASVVESLFAKHRECENLREILCTDILGYFTERHCNIAITTGARDCAMRAAHPARICLERILRAMREAPRDRVITREHVDTLDSALLVFMRGVLAQVARLSRSTSVIIGADELEPLIRALCG